MNQELVYLKLNEEHKFERVFDKDIRFDTFINGFKLVFINSNVIRQVYVNDTILRSYPLKTDVKLMTQNLLDTLGGYYDLVVSSDIHLHCFHLELLIQLSREDRIKRVVIAGDVLYKIPYNEQRPSVKRATDAITKLLTNNLSFIYEAESMKITDSDVTERDKLIWITGNHDRTTSVPQQCSKLITLLEHLALVFETNIGGYEFRIQHGALEDEYDPRSSRPEPLSEKYDKYITGNRYLILGHEMKYNRYKNDDLVNNYTIEHKHSVYRVSIGKFTLTDEYTDDGPEFIIDDGSKDGLRGKFGMAVAFDLYQQCVEANVTKQVHYICTDNIRAVTPINATDDFQEFEMFGGKASVISYKWIILVIVLMCLIVAVIIVTCISMSHCCCHNSDLH